MSTPNPPPRFDRVSKRWSGPNACASLSLILASPTPVERLGRVFVSRNPGPVSVTVICTLSPASRAWTTISAPSSLGVTAYLIAFRSEEHTSELQSLMRISYAAFCLKKQINELHVD